MNEIDKKNAENIQKAAEAIEKADSPKVKASLVALQAAMQGLDLLFPALAKIPTSQRFTYIASRSSYKNRRLPKKRRNK